VVRLTPTDALRVDWTAPPLAPPAGSLKIVVSTVRFCPSPPPH